MKHNIGATPRQRVRQLLQEGRSDLIPKGELCISDDVEFNSLAFGQADFAQKLAFTQELSLDIITVPPALPCALKSLPQLKDYQWPDLTNWVGETELFTLAILDGAFEWGMRLLGVSEFCVMLRQSPLSMQEIVSQVEAVNCQLVERLIDQGIDGFILADDIAHSHGLFTSPKDLKGAFIPSLARQVEKIRNADYPVFYHSDGDYRMVIGDIVGAGFNGLQCLEKSANMNIGEIRSQFGPKLCLWGHLEVEDINQAEDQALREQLVQEIKNVADGGSFILGTTSGLFSGMNMETLQQIYQEF